MDSRCIDWENISKKLVCLDLSGSKNVDDRFLYRLHNSRIGRKIKSLKLKKTECRIESLIKYYKDIEELSINLVSKEEIKLFENLKYFKGNILNYKQNYAKFLPNCKYYDDGNLMVEEREEKNEKEEKEEEINEKKFLKNAKKLKFRKLDDIPEVQLFHFKFYFFIFLF